MHRNRPLRCDRDETMRALGLLCALARVAAAGDAADGLCDALGRCVLPVARPLSGSVRYRGVSAPPLKSRMRIVSSC